jgi:hypothetical protein
MSDRKTAKQAETSGCRAIYRREAGTWKIWHESASITAGMRKYRSCLDVYGPRPIAIDFSELRFKVTTADVYPASLRGLIDHRREPRWIFARFHLNGAKALAEAMPVQTPGSGSDGGDPSRHRPPFDCNCR